MDFENPPQDPIAQFHRWLEEARQRTELPNPNAMTLATVDPDARPSARIILLKHLDADGAVFYTNRQSRKGKALESHPFATLLSHWDALDRQVRIEGGVSLTNDEESDAYFATRPRPAQIGAWASRQSEPASSRTELEEAIAEVERRYEGIDVPRPPHWGGYRMRIEMIEFWQGHKFRLHDRIVYTPGGAGGWNTQRLFP